MDLICWRHADAEDPRQRQDDLDRALTSRGQKQAARVGAWLHRELPKDARILCSPALRCQQTALALHRHFTICLELAPGATPEDVLRVAQWPGAAGTVLVVGHQPTLGATIAQVLQLREADCAVRKGAAWWLRTRAGDAQPQAVLWAVQPPETA